MLTPSSFFLFCAGRADMHGSLEPGKQGNMVLLRAPTWEHVLYEVADPPIAAVVVGGAVMYKSKEGLLG